MDPTDDTDIVLPHKDIDDKEDNLSIKSEDDDDDLGRYLLKHSVISTTSTFFTIFSGEWVKNG